jgi:hypothetical protein
MDDIQVVIIDSVQPSNPDLLDKMEEKWINRPRKMNNKGKGADMKIVAGTTGTPAEPFTQK